MRGIYAGHAPVIHGTFAVNTVIMSKRSPDLSQRNAEPTPSERPPRAKRKAVQPKLYINFLPNGKRSTPAEFEDKGSVPLEVDVELHIEERTDCEPGLYRIERKRSGEFSGEVLFYPKEDFQGGAPLGFDSPGKERDEEQTAASTSDDTRLAQMVAGAVNAALDARDRRERATQGQPSTIDMVRELDELAERRADRERQRSAEIRQEIAAMLPKESPSQQQNQFGVFSAMLGDALKLVDQVAPIREATQEDRGVMREILDTARDAINSPNTGPAIGTLVRGAAQRLVQRPAAPTAPHNGHAPQATSKPSPTIAATAPAREAPAPESTEHEGAEDRLQIVTEDLSVDMVEDRPVAAAVRDIESLIEDEPERLPAIQALIAAPVEQLRSVLAQNVPNSAEVLAAPHGLEWLAALQIEVARRLNLTQPFVDPSANGHDTGVQEIA